MSNYFQLHGHAEDAPLITGGTPHQSVKRANTEDDDVLVDYTDGYHNTGSWEHKNPQHIDRDTSSGAESYRQVSLQPVKLRKLNPEEMKSYASSSTMNASGPVITDAIVTSNDAFKLVNGKLYHQAPTGKWRCTMPQRPKTYDSISSVERHFEAKHNGPVPRYLCTICKTSFVEQRWVYRHQKTTSAKYAKCNNAWNSGLVPGAPGYVLPSIVARFTGPNSYQPQVPQPSDSHATASSYHRLDPASQTTDDVQRSNSTLHDSSTKGFTSLPPRDASLMSFTPSVNETLDTRHHDQPDSTGRVDILMPKKLQGGINTSLVFKGLPGRTYTQIVNTNQFSDLQGHPRPLVAQASVARDSEASNGNDDQFEKCSPYGPPPVSTPSSRSQPLYHVAASNNAASSFGEVQCSPVPLIMDDKPTPKMRLSDPLYWWNIAQPLRNSGDKGFRCEGDEKHQKPGLICITYQN